MPGCAANRVVVAGANVGIVVTSPRPRPRRSAATMSKLKAHHLLDNAIDRVSFLHGREASNAPPIEEHVGRFRDEYGLNMRPGPEDDGWVHTDPVRLRDGTQVQLYKDGEAAVAAFRAIEGARHRVLLEVYIWSSDETGRRFAELLARKAREGVRVFVLYDGFGSFLADKAMFQHMREAGVQVIEFHPALPWRSRWGWRLFGRDHRKILVVDDNIAGISGLNIGNRYAGNWVAPDAHVNPEKMWRDAGVGLVGDGVADPFAEAFARTWRYCLRRFPIRHTLAIHGLNIELPKTGRIGKIRESYHGFRPRPGCSPTSLMVDGQDIGVLGTSPTLSSPLRPFLYQLVRDARKSLSFTMAYFAPDDELIAGICAAAKRGVRVRLMFAARSDAKVLVIAARSFYHRLLEAGCEVYERGGAMLHQKSIVADGELSVLGSTNLDYRSIEFNLELAAVIRNREFARQLDLMFDHDVQFAERIELCKWRSQPLRDRVIQWCVSRVRYLL